MKIIVRSLVLAIVLSVASIWMMESAQAAYNPKGKCRSSYRTWQGSVGWGAFATNRRGTYCSWSRGYGSKQKATQAALRKCGRKRRCRIIRTRAPRKQARLRTECLASFRKWKKESGYRAFALARNGDYCGYSWNHRDLASARKAAMETCKSKSGCTIYSTLVPIDVLKVRQNHLKSLKLYKGKIDGIWGRGTKRAMLAFSRWTDHPNSDDDEIYERLKWAALMVRANDLEPKEAAENSERAAKERSIAFLARNVANEAGLRTPEFEAKIGYGLGAKKWPLGRDSWIYSERQPKANELAPVCMLAADGLVIAHFASAEVGTVLLHNRQDMPLGPKAAKISFNGGSYEEPVVGSKAIGTHIQLKNFTQMYLKLLASNYIKVEFSDEKFTKTYTVANFDNQLNAFASCIIKSRAAPIPVAANANISNSSTTDIGIAEARRGTNGQYSFLVELNAEPIVMLVDTGATKVTISESMARRIGIKLTDNDFTHKVATANGITVSAQATAQELRIGDISIRDVELSVLKDKSLVGSALLGMTFLNRLTKFEFSGQTLKLIQ